MDTDRTAAVETWIKSGCMECEFTDYSPEDSSSVRDGRCPNDGSVLLRMDGLIVADDVITIARLLVKADKERRTAEREAIAARADLGRVNDLVYRRINELRITP